MKQKTPKNRVDLHNSIIEGIETGWPRPFAGLVHKSPARSDSEG